MAGGGGAEEPSPVISLSANGGIEIDLLRGWPVLLELEILHPAAFQAQAAAPDLLISPAGGDWERAIRFSMKDGTGNETSPGFLAQGPAAASIVLQPGNVATARYWILPDESQRLAAGDHELRATLDTTSSTSGWSGLAAAERVVLHTADEPAPLPPELAAQKLLHFTRFHLWRGDLDTASAELEELEERFPGSIEGLLLEGRILEARGSDRGALSAYELALDLFEARFPDAPELPAELLAAHRVTQARIVEGKLPAELIRFRRGEFNGDGQLNITDPVAVLAFLFLGASPDHECLASADSNGDGQVNLTDAVYTLGFLFLGTSKPPEPFPECGENPGGVGPGCERSNGCPP